MNTQTFIERRHGERRQTPVRTDVASDTSEAAVAGSSQPLGGATTGSPPEGTPGRYGAGYGEAASTQRGPIDEHYDRWRADHLRQLDDEYSLWRQGGSKNFPADFEAWRLARLQE